MKETQRESLKILIIVPAFNEEEAIAGTIGNLLNVRDRFPGLDICVINDGSKDGTADIVRKYPEVVLLDLPNNLGIGGAVQTGYKYADYAGYDIAVQFDADGQHSAAELETIITPVADGECDMCIGSRFVEKTDYSGSPFRRMGIFYFERLIRLLSGQRVTDPTSGFRAVNREIIQLFSEAYPSDYPEPEVIIYLRRKKKRIQEKAVRMHSRQGGESSITPFKSIYYMAKVTLSIVMQRLVGGRV
ncbi:Poly-beta-1,6-N-acetyl-D-glucosamine synthase [Bhargavaea cecembensis DSE10]|uniref:Poly-beta-1,6-N-acetyl-D-glucosamine synthase n=1 Tax=Bhargavaea cecembensis DSE10 TaxID=1235279 RepID=M7NDH0_9BACL|nr:glycosyltransferase family 2 protein [Bhargavaea cecembensis]EMR06623.1 Poly-beta-1,6-N-acetyl-D-glucosamine synthase [Bhargavaea cecembensis DSE10]